MEVVNFTNYKFNKMQKFILPSSVTSTECELFFLPTKDKWDNTAKLFKKFYIDSGEYLGNKILTINTLINDTNKINIDELVMPEELVAINDKICGYMMSYIDSTNLGTILSDLNVPLERKIELLKKVGMIIEKVNNANKYRKRFYLGDIHENNFIVEKMGGELRVVDLDSAHIGDNKPFPSRYLHSIGNKKGIKLHNKYKLNEDGIFIPGENSELLCYNIMVLNLICNSKIHTLSIDDFYYYLDYLKTLGFEVDLLDCFSTIYSNRDSANPLEYLDSIPDNIARADINVFKHIHKKR